MKWVKVHDKMKDGRYYVKMLMNNLTILKGCETIRNGVWQLGSGWLVIKEVLEYLDETDDDNNH